VTSKIEHLNKLWHNGIILTPLMSKSPYRELPVPRTMDFDDVSRRHQNHAIQIAVIHLPPFTVNEYDVGMNKPFIPRSNWVPGPGTLHECFRPFKTRNGHETFYSFALCLSALLFYTRFVIFNSYIIMGNTSNAHNLT